MPGILSHIPAMTISVFKGRNHEFTLVFASSSVCLFTSSALGEPLGPNHTDAGWVCIAQGASSDARRSFWKFVISILVK